MPQGADLLRTAGKSAFADTARGMPKLEVVMASVSKSLAHYEPDTRTWTGFAPDFLKLLSNDLGFTYEITDERMLCDLTMVEVFRAFHRANMAGTMCADRYGNGTEKRACCEFAGSKEYESRDQQGFTIVPAGTCTAEGSLRSVRLGAIEVCENPESEFALTIAAPTFPFVHLDGPNKGEVLHATCMLNSGVGEHPRATPFNPELAVFEDVPRQYGDALPSTPMYTEKIETLVFTTTAQGMWNLFKPFSWQLWIAIVGMVRTPTYGRQRR